MFAFAWRRSYEAVLHAKRRMLYHAQLTKTAMLSNASAGACLCLCPWLVGPIETGARAAGTEEP